LETGKAELAWEYPLMKKSISPFCLKGVMSATPVPRNFVFNIKENEW
jgi:hypothetical protein